MERPLSELLKLWRAERPDEWTMDEFIREAERIEKQLQNTSSISDCVVQPSATPKSCANCFWKDKPPISACNGCYDESNWEERT